MVICTVQLLVLWHKIYLYSKLLFHHTTFWYFLALYQVNGDYAGSKLCVDGIWILGNTGTLFLPLYDLSTCVIASKGNIQPAPDGMTVLQFLPSSPVHRIWILHFAIKETESRESKPPQVHTGWTGFRSRPVFPQTLFSFHLLLDLLSSPPFSPYECAILGNEEKNFSL